MQLQVSRVLPQIGRVLVVIGLVEPCPVEREFLVLMRQLVGPLLQTSVDLAVGFVCHDWILRLPLAGTNPDSSDVTRL